MNVAREGSLRVTLAGAGSTYFSAGFVADLLASRALPGGFLTLFDLDPSRLEVMDGYARRASTELGGRWRVEATTDRRQAVEGADFVVVSIGVGGLESRRRDVEVALRHGVIQVSGDTIGPGGISRALRNIPAILELARDVEELAPSAWLVNYSNPLSSIVWALAQETKLRVVGLCPGIPHLMQSVAPRLGVAAEEIEVDVAGLNHCSWLTGFRVAGVDAYDRLRAYVETSGLDPVAVALEQLYGYYPMPGGVHAAEFFPYLIRAGGEAAREFGIEPWHADKVIAGRRGNLEEVARQARGEAPLRLGTGGSSDMAVGVVEAIGARRRRTEIVNVRNGGAIPNLAPEAVVEVPAMVGPEGIRPILAEPLPRALAAASSLAIAEQALTVEAALTGDRRAALQALMVNPTVPTIAQARALLDDLLAAQADYLPQFR